DCLFKTARKLRRQMRISRRPPLVAAIFHAKAKMPCSQSATMALSGRLKSTAQKATGKSGGNRDAGSIKSDDAGFCMAINSLKDHRWREMRIPRDCILHGQLFTDHIFSLVRPSRSVHRHTTPSDSVCKTKNRDGSKHGRVTPSQTSSAA